VSVDYAELAAVLVEDAERLEGAEVAPNGACPLLPIGNRGQAGEVFSTLNNEQVRGAAS
jgi:hypothetical protein